jgi:hypothetical protein
VYYAAAHPGRGNASHRMHVLGGPPATDDPTTGQWEFLGRIHGLPEDQWAIDGTVFALGRELYFVYSGWPLENRGGPDAEDDHVQQLFIVRLEDPTLAATRPVLISTPELPWEFSGDRGINEGPQFLRSPGPLPPPASMPWATGRGNGGSRSRSRGPGGRRRSLRVSNHRHEEAVVSSGSDSERDSDDSNDDEDDDDDDTWKGIVYSCAGSWTHEYKLAVLHYNGGDPLDPRSWPKSQEPLLQAPLHGRGPWGPGHGSFLTLADGANNNNNNNNAYKRLGDAHDTTTICVFHGTDSRTDGWSNRKARYQKVAFTASGPYMGVYCGGMELHFQQQLRGGLERRAARRSGLMGKLRERFGQRRNKFLRRSESIMRTLLQSH